MSPAYIWDQHFSFGGVLLCPYSPKLLLYFPRLSIWHRPRSNRNTRYLHNTWCYGMPGYTYICQWMHILVPMRNPCNLELGFSSAEVHTSKYTNARCSKFVIYVQLIRSLPSRWPTSNQFSLRGKSGVKTNILVFLLTDRTGCFVMTCFLYLSLAREVSMAKQGPSDPLTWSSHVNA